MLVSGRLFLRLFGYKFEVFQNRNMTRDTSMLQRVALRPFYGHCGVWCVSSVSGGGISHCSFTPEDLARGEVVDPERGSQAVGR